MKITIVGAGKSGIAAATKLQASHAVFLTEEKDSIDLTAHRALKKLNIPFELGGHTVKALKGTDLIVVSPGVPLAIPLLKAARQKKIPIIGEVELSFLFIKKPIIAVTGTNGKTTTTALIGEMLKDGGFSVAVAGNIGYPLISVVDTKLDYIVAEISSYQLETINRFKPWISIILNITEDHLTRHGTMKEYSRQKAAIFKNQAQGDFLVYNADDKIVSGISNKAKCKKIGFSRRNGIKDGAFVKDGIIYFGRKRICRTGDIRIKGDHNIENALAAVSAAMLCNVPVSSIRNTLERFKGVEHRIEFVRKIKGVSFYNDSKGTNPDSTIVALKALSPAHDLVLILGGRDKMTDLAKLCMSVKKNVKDVVLIGEATERFRNNLRKSGFAKIHTSKSLKEAVKSSYSLARSGDAVLLSPACASFDMFKDYEERGKVFKKIVANL